VTEDALTLVSEVPATPPKVTNVVLVRLVPEIVTKVPPAVGPADGATKVMVFDGIAMTMEALAATGVVSEDVFTVKPAAAYVALIGFTIPAILKVPDLFWGSVQPAARVTVTVDPVVEPVPVQPVAKVFAPVVNPIVGTAGIVNAEGNTAVIVSPAARSLPVLLPVLKVTDHVVWAYATCDAPANETELKACAG